MFGQCKEMKQVNGFIISRKKRTSVLFQYMYISLLFKNTKTSLFKRKLILNRYTADFFMAQLLGN